MTDRSEKVKAGIFVVITVSLLMALLILVAGLRVFKTTKTFHVRFSESITGLEESSTVRYIGVPVGRVSKIGFSEGEDTVIDVTIEVNPDTPIRVKTRAQLKPQGITGISYIDLYDADSEMVAPVPRDDNLLLAEGATIPTEQSITKDLLDTLGELRKLLANMNNVVENNQEAVTVAVQSIQEAAVALSASLDKLPDAVGAVSELTREVREMLGAALTSAVNTLAEIEAFASDPAIRQIPGKVVSVLDRADSVLLTAEDAITEVDLKEVMTSLTSVLERLDRTAEEITAAVSVVKGGVSRNTGNLSRIMSDLRVFSTTLRQLAQEIREKPNRLLLSRGRVERKEED